MNTNMLGVTMMYTNGQAPLKELPTIASRKLLDIPLNALVIHTGKVEPAPVKYLEVEYGNKRGWVYSAYLDEYVENLPKDCVKSDIKTPDPLDPEQFANYNSARQVNLCGFWAAAFILDEKLETVLNNFELKNPSFWARIFGRKNGAKIAGGTSPLDLIAMFNSFVIPAVDLTSAMTDPVLKRARYTVDALDLFMQSHDVILSVNIDGTNGKLRGAGVLHWVVPVKVYKERLGGAVELYNPFSNRIEIYSWTDFVASARQPYGVAVAK